MTDTNARFERDLREILAEMAPDDAPSRLRDAVAGIPYRPGRRRLSFAWTGRRAAAVTAVAVVAVMAVGVGMGLIGFPGAGPNVGGPAATASPSPTAPPAGLRIEYEVAPLNGIRPTQDDVAVVAAVIRRRLDTTGIVEPSVTTVPSGRIIVALAVDPADEATTGILRQLIGTTGRIDVVPLGYTPASAGDIIDLAAHPPLFSGDQIASARIGADQAGQRTIDLTLRPDGASAFAAYTRAHTGEYFAFVLDGVALTAPVINEAIEKGELQIVSSAVGGFSLDQAQTLVTIAAFGPLPFPVQEVSNNLP